jgi:hypothetical protein
LAVGVPNSLICPTGAPTALPHSTSATTSAAGTIHRRFAGPFTRVPLISAPYRTPNGGARRLPVG